MVASSVPRSDSGKVTVIADEPATVQAELVDEATIAQAVIAEEPATAQAELADEPATVQAATADEPATTQAKLADEATIAQAKLPVLESELQQDPCEIAALAREITATQAVALALDSESQSDSDETAINNEEPEGTRVKSSVIEQTVAKLMADIAGRHVKVQAKRAAKFQAVRAEFKKFREAKLLQVNIKGLTAAAAQSDAHLHAEPSHSAPALQKPAQDGDVPPTV
ncbi:hypothetical protein IW147_002650 [Coemansia sp. RSA 720]|nr:hypothetical protein IW147_002650 [Coemansia sp. RSA 720]